MEVKIIKKQVNESINNLIDKQVNITNNEYTKVKRNWKVLIVLLTEYRE